MRTPWRRPIPPALKPLRAEIRVSAASPRPATTPVPATQPHGAELGAPDHLLQLTVSVPTPRRIWADGEESAAPPRPFGPGTITSIPSPPDPFDQLVRAALDELPPAFLATLADVPVVISNDGDLHGAYGLYRGASIANPGVPAQIFIFRDTLGRHFGHDPQLLAAQVRRVVRHELGHHLGFDEDGVARLGL